MKATQNTEDTIDLKELFFAIIAQWKLIALCVVLSLIVAMLYLRITPDTYSVNALVQVEESKGASAALLGNLSNMIEQKQPAQAEIEILKSRLVLGSAIQALNLDILIQSTQSNLWDRIVASHHHQITYEHNKVVFSDNQQGFEIQKLDIPTQYLDQALTLSFADGYYQLSDTASQKVIFKGQLNKNSHAQHQNGTWNVGIYSQHNLKQNYQIQKMSLPAAVQHLSRNYAVMEKGKLSGILGLNYQGHDKKHISKVLNAILTAYSQQNIERRTAETAQTLSFLDQRLPQLEQELDHAEREFNQFRERYNTVDVSKESDLYLTQSMSLETRKAELQQRHAELSAKYTNEHPAMQEIDAQLAALDAKMTELESILKKLPDLQRQYLQLYRKVEVQQQLYTTLLNSSQQLKVAQAGAIGSVRIVDHAVEPIQPIAPKKNTILLLALLLGLASGTLLALVRQLLRHGLKDAQQIEQAFDLPVYATVPRSKIQLGHSKLWRQSKHLPILALKYNNDLAIESLRSMRTAIHFTLSQGKNKVIMIAGPSPEVGKSFITINLAAILAQNNKRVLLIDSDMRRGYLHRYFKNVNMLGLSEYLSGQAQLPQVVQKTDVSYLDIVTRGKSPVNPSELLNSEQFPEMLKQLSENYDHIIIDTPPILAVTDSMIIGQYSGMNLMVARYAKSDMNELKHALNRFENVGVKINGFILNDIQKASGRSGYGYNYIYQYQSQNQKQSSLD